MQVALTSRSCYKQSPSTKTGEIMTEVKDLVCSFDSLYRAMKVCRKDVGWKDSVTRFTNDGLRSVYRLKSSLLDGSYKIDSYYIFNICEPKLRKIIATKLKDRVFQRSLCDNYLTEALTKGFIYDNFACIEGKGPDLARERLECHSQRYYRKYGAEGYVLTCDIKDYFGSTPHSTAKSAVKERVDNEWVYEHVCRIIDSFGTKENPDTGMGLGSQVTQLIQLAVLDDLDHYIKEQLRIKYYLRYMDDFPLIHRSKEYLRYCLEMIKRKLKKLGLTLNEKKTQILKLSQGIRFLGFKFVLTDTGKVVKTLLKSNTKRRKRKIKKYKILYDKGLMTKEKVDMTDVGWEAHAEKGDTAQVRRGMRIYKKRVWGGEFVYA